VPDLDETRAAPATSLGSAPADDAASGPTEMPVNEIVKSAQLAKEGEEKAEANSSDNRNAWIAAGVGVGVGIGSAALVAALLYASRDKGKDGAKKK
jgi:hypothetical protein